MQRPTSARSRRTLIRDAATLALTPLFAAVLSGGVPCQNHGLDWLRWLGGPGQDTPHPINALKVTPNGDLLVVGRTDGRFPATAPGIGPGGGAYDAFVARLSADGATVRWAVTLGGTSDDAAVAVEVDRTDRHVLVSGPTGSRDFPITPLTAAQTTHGGGRYDIYAVVLDAATGKQTYGTYLGGSGHENPIGSAPDAAGQGFWITGNSESTDFPTTGTAYQRALKGNGDVVIVHIDPAIPGRAGLVYSTYLGGSNSEGGMDLHVAGNGLVTLAGETQSPDFPTTAGAWKTAYSGGYRDGFALQLDPRRPPAQQITWSTFVGGTDDDNGNAMDVAPDGRVVVGGWTKSTGLATSNAPHKAPSGGYDAYVVVLDPSVAGAGQRGFGTYLGGANDEGVNDLVVDAAGMITIGSNTWSGGMPTTAGSWQVSGPGGPAFDAYVARIDPVAGRVLYASYLGASVGNTGGSCVRVDGSGGVFALGYSRAANLPVSVGPRHAGDWDLWIARLNLLPDGAARAGASTPSSAGPSYVGVDRQPRSGDGQFRIWAGGAPQATGCSVLGGVLVSLAVDPTGTRIPGLPALHVTLPAVFVPVNPSRGRVDIPAPLTNVPTGTRAALQFLWSECPSQRLSATNALQLVVR